MVAGDPEIIGALLPLDEPEDELVDEPAAELLPPPQAARSRATVATETSDNVRTSVLTFLGTNLTST